MKIQKSILKGLIKECLIEVLAEGLGTPQKLQESLTKKVITQSQVPIKTQPQIKEAAREVITMAAAGNNTMAAIFEDTLKTSYAAQQSAEIPNAAQALRQAQMSATTITESNDNVMPEIQGSKSWSAIAFGE